MAERTRNDNNDPASHDIAKELATRVRDGTDPAPIRDRVRATAPEVQFRRRGAGPGEN